MEDVFDDVSTCLPTTAIDRRTAPRREEDRRCVLLAKAAKSLMNAARQAQIVLDENSFVLLVNNAARRLLATTDEMKINRKMLAVKNDSNRAGLLRVVSGEVREISFTILARGQSIPISARLLHVSRPLGRLIVINSAEEPFYAHSQIGEVLGLTKAELEIALSIHKGQSLVSIAKQRGVSINTVKTQVRCIFQKCGVRSQIELARLVTTIQTSSDLAFGKPGSPHLDHRAKHPDISLSKIHSR